MEKRLCTNLSVISRICPPDKPQDGGVGKGWRVAPASTWMGPRLVQQMQRGVEMRADVDGRGGLDLIESGRVRGRSAPRSCLPVLSCVYSVPVELELFFSSGPQSEAKGFHSAAHVESQPNT